MTLVLNLPPEAEKRLHEKAAQNGLAPQDYVLRLLISDVPPLNLPSQKAEHLSFEESRLLSQINEGIAAEVWAQYDALVQKRRAGTLTPEEHTALLAVSDRIEEKNAARMGHVAELARLRGKDLSTLMRELGIGPRKKTTVL